MSDNGLVMHGHEYRPFVAGSFPAMSVLEATESSEVSFFHPLTVHTVPRAEGTKYGVVI